MVDSTWIAKYKNEMIQLYGLLLEQYGVQSDVRIDATRFGYVRVHLNGRPTWELEIKVENLRDYLDSAHLSDN